MKNERLFQAIGAADDELIQRSAASEKSTKKRKRRIRWVASAACILAAAMFAVAILKSIKTTSDDPGEVPQITSGIVQSNSEAIKSVASSKYSNLEDLLSYLSEHDNHSMNAAGDSSPNIPGTRESESAAEGFTAESYSVVYKGYSYHTSDSGVHITKLNGKNTERVGGIDCVASSVFVYGDSLVLVGYEYVTADNSEFTEKTRVYARLYNLADPENPVLKDELVQTGSLTGCYIEDGKLYVLSSDGVCACGYSRLEDTSGFVPVFTHNGEVMELDDSDISILGEPTSVWYVATMVYDLNVSEVTGTNVCYGDIKECFYGKGYLAFSVSATVGDMMTLPEVFIFEPDADGYVFSARVSMAAMLGVPDSYTYKDSEFTNVNVISVCPSETNYERNDNIFRVVGCIYEKSGDESSSHLFTAAVDTLHNSVDYATSDAVGMGAQINEIVEEKERQIISWSVFDIDNGTHNNYFAFAEYSGATVNLITSDMQIDHISGIDTIMTYGNPYGYIFTITDIGNGIYARYNYPPNGIDLFNLSDSRKPLLIYDSPGELEGDDRYCLQSYVMSDNSLGVLASRSDGLFFEIYDIDVTAESPYSLRKSIAVDVERGLIGSDVPAFDLFDYNGEYYYTSWYSDSANPL